MLVLLYATGCEPIYNEPLVAIISYMNPDMIQLIRTYKIQNLSDDDITKNLSATYSQEEIKAGLAALQYMRPADQQIYADTANPISPTTSDSTTPATSYTLEVVKNIIKKREKASASGFMIVASGLAASAFFETSIAKPALLVTAAVLLPPILIVHLVNTWNRKQVQPSYQAWNKWVYIYIPRLLIIGAIFEILSSIKNILNPMYGFKNPSALSRSAMALDMGIEAGGAASARASLRPAKYVDEYFKYLKKS